MAWNSSNFAASYWDRSYWRAVISAGGFPTQYDGLYYWDGAAVQGICLVAAVDAPSGMGGVWLVDATTGTYAVYLVETTDGDASTVYCETTTGVKAARFKT